MEPSSHCPNPDSALDTADTADTAEALATAHTRTDAPAPTSTSTEGAASTARHSSMSAAPALMRDQEALFRLLYPELRLLARSKMALLPRSSPLQATALVHEAYLRLHKRARNTEGWHGRQHFMAVAAKVMWSIIVDQLRQQRAQKRGGGRVRVTLSDADAAITVHADQFLDLERAMNALRRHEPGIAEIVLLRCIAGLTVAEIARLRNLSESTVYRRWTFARTWLYRELNRTTA